MEKLREETITNVRACLISVKGKVDVRQLNKDYAQLMGHEIPYRRLGFPNLENFLASVPTLIISRGPNGAVLVDAKSNDKTAHISHMVARQKAAKKKPVVTRTVHKPAYKYNNYNQQNNQYTSMQTPNTNNTWRPKNVSNKFRTNFENPSRPAAMSHNQFVNITQTAQPPKQHAPPPSTPSIIPTNPANARLKPLVNHNNNIPKPQIQHQNSKPKVNVPTLDVNRGAIQSRMEKLGVSRSPDIENLKRDALNAVDVNDPMWNKWTSDSDSDNSFTKEKHFVATGDCVKDLENFIKFHNLPALVCKTHKTQTKPHKPFMYMCQLKADGESYGNYPDDCFDEHRAKLLAYTRAYEALLKKYGTSNRRNMLLSNDRDILERVPLLVKKHYTGIWSWQVEADYKDLYSEQLPPNWLEVLSASPNISMESYDRKFVLHYCRPEDKGKLTSLPLSYDVSIPTSNFQFDENTRFIAEVTCAVSTKEIWCRQIQTEQAADFDKMIKMMESTYNKDKQQKNSMKAAVIAKSCYYAAFIEDCWFRVRVLNVTDEGVEVYLVDRGDDQLVQKDCIYKLRREFAREPCQAFVCQLAGLEDLYEVSVGSEHLANLEGSRIRLEPCMDENYNTEIDSITAIFYDADTGEIINQELMRLITVENALPTLDKTVLNEVYISHVDPKTNDICIQLRTLGFEKLMTLMADLEVFISDKKQEIPIAKVTPKSNPDSLYFMKTKEDNKYYRVCINDWSPCKSMVQIYYIDIGRTAVIKVDETVFLPLDELSSVISRFPGQVLRVRLDLEKTPPNFVDQIGKLCPNDSPVLLRVVDEKEQVFVKLFVRVDNGFFSVNESISVSLEPRAKSASPVMDKVGNKLVKLENNVPSTGNLKSPELPKIGELFDVFIPTAVHPFNFFVQPYKSQQQLNSMMKEIQARFADPSKLKKLGIEDVVPGGIYASNFNGKWFRTSVIKTIHPSTISVFYCDFGHYATVSHLYPLDPSFLELPYQAIKAKLIGIMPSQGKWTMADCKYFTELVTKKPYVSLLQSIDSDEMYNIDKVLGLKLIDTSKAEDVHIDEVLVEKKIAIRA